VLYLIAGNALLDGYLREAVLSFTGAMERYFEFAVRVLARSNGIPQASLDTAWNLVSKQSERQFGAFVLAWLFEAQEHFSEAPLAAIQRHAEFRNGVVHKGKIPRSEECLAYGQHVANVIAPIERFLQSNHAASHKDECFALARLVGSSSDEPLTILSEFSVLDSILTRGTTLQEALARLAAQRAFLGEPAPAIERIIQRSIQVIGV
jgi:hypothetical protein